MFASRAGLRARSLPTTDYRLPTRRRRRGISLLEVLISMFVLLFGLMGVAAVFPVGNHYAGRGEQYDRAAALTDQAFAEIKARGMLNPSVWMYPEAPQLQVEMASENNVFRVMLPTTFSMAGTFNVQLHNVGTTTIGPGHAFVLDPLGTSVALQETTERRQVDCFPFAYMGGQYPDGRLGSPGKADRSTNAVNPPEWRNTGVPANDLYGTRWPVRRITVPSNNALTPTMTPEVAETLCRLRDDMANSEPDQDDRPGLMRWQSQVVGPIDDPSKFDPNNSATFGYGDDVPLSRQNTGAYSWIATIVPTSSNNAMQIPDALQGLQPRDSNYGSFLYDVSVAVFFKRQVAPSAASERSIDAQLFPGNELVLYSKNASNAAAAEQSLEAALVDIRPGNWIALAGTNPNNGVFLLKWYRILSLEDETNPIVGLGPARRATLDGPEWPMVPDAAGAIKADNLRAIILPGVIGVSTQSLPMEPAS